MTTEWRYCCEVPEMDGHYKVQCLFPDGEPLGDPEMARYSRSEWIPSHGLQVMPHDQWREVE